MFFVGQGELSSAKMNIEQQCKKLLFVVYLIILIKKPSFSLREERLFFPIIPFYRVQTVSPIPCVEAGNLEGTCNSVSRCRNAGLTPSSPCPGNQGICCIDIKNCGGTSSSPVVYFRSATNTASTACSLTITKTNSSICQLRLDFLDFTLPQPVNGSCNDFLQLSLGETYLPKICGENTGQHVYVEFLPNCVDQSLSFKFQNALSANRVWNIKITQIPCYSPLTAPRGCLQYYTSLMGTVNSFNYGAQEAGVLRQLSPLNYTVCILPQYGYCSITWRNSTSSSFRLQDPTNSTCISNYVAINSPYCGNLPCPDSRFCGSSFLEATSSSRIFELQVFNNYQGATNEDIGFSLNYQQILCN